MILHEGRRAERSPHVPGVGVIDVADVRVGEVVIGKDPLPRQQLGYGSVTVQVAECVNRQAGHQLIQ